LRVQNTAEKVGHILAGYLTKFKFNAGLRSVVS